MDKVIYSLLFDFDYSPWLSNDSLNDIYSIFLDFVNKTEGSFSLVFPNNFSNYLYHNNLEALIKTINLAEAGKIELINSTPNNEFLYGLNKNEFDSLINIHNYYLPTDDTFGLNQRIINLNHDGFYSGDNYLSSTILDYLSKSKHSFSFFPLDALSDRDILSFFTSIKNKKGIDLFYIKNISKEDSNLFNENYLYYLLNQNELLIRLSNNHEISKRTYNDRENKIYLSYIIHRDEINYFYKLYNHFIDYNHHNNNPKINFLSFSKLSNLFPRENDSIDLDNYFNYFVKDNPDYYDKNRGLLFYKFINVRKYINNIYEKNNLLNFLRLSHYINGDILNKLNELKNKTRFFNDYYVIREIKRTKSNKLIQSDLSSKLIRYLNEVIKISDDLDLFYSVFHYKKQNYSVKFNKNYYNKVNVFNLDHYKNMYKNNQTNVPCEILDDANLNIKNKKEDLKNKKISENSNENFNNYIKRGLLNIFI